MIRILFAMMLCSSAMGQSISVSSGRSSFIVSGKKAPEIVPVKVSGSETVNLERTESPTRFKFSSKMAETTTKPVAVQTMSHAEMVATHNRLHGGGSWTWPGDLATHLRTVHGVNTTRASQTTSQPAVRVQQSACPGGRCPTPTNRRRLFR